MKKLLAVSMGVLLLVGCSNDKVETPEATENDQSSAIEMTEPEVDVVVEDATEDVETPEQSQDLEGYEEYQLLSENIDLATYQAEVTTDNNGNRVLLFTDADGKKTYKSVYTKHDNYLKIIKLDDEGLLFNGKVN